MAQSGVTIDVKFGIMQMKISGHINERLVFELPQLNSIKQISVDMEGVTLINSAGLQKWMGFIKLIKSLKPVPSLSLIHVPKVFADQLNMVKDMLPQQSTIKSFYVPYHCESCESAKYVLYSSGREYKIDNQGNYVDLKIPSVNCDPCDTTMDIDVHPKKYFSFIFQFKKSA